MPGTDPVPGTVTAPGESLLRGWVVLHGVSRLGRDHPELARFVRALASTGQRVLVPEIRDWIELRLAPERARAVISAAVDWLHAHENGAPGGVVLMGFSFGAPQALLVASDPRSAGRVRSVIGWGGYADIERTFRFSLTGEHEWEGTLHRWRPDPYVRWVIGRNALPLSDALRGNEGVVQALHDLAVEAGERRLESWHPSSDPLKERFRSGLRPSERSLFDLFAPPSDRDPDRAGVEEIIGELVPVMRRELPTLEPLPGVGKLPGPVRLLHSRSDHLIPYTETLRLGRGLCSAAPLIDTRLIGLFSHSGDPITHSIAGRTVENIRLLAALKDLFEVA